MAKAQFYKEGNILYPKTKKEYVEGMGSIGRSVSKFNCYFGAHRGFASVAPENTLPAFKAAAKAGFSLIEVDLVQSSDGVQFCLHDATINRTSNGTGTASSMTAEQLLSYDFGYPSKFGNEFAGTKIPTLREFLIFCKKNNLYAELDIADDSRYSNSYLPTTYQVVQECGMLDATFFCAKRTRLNALYEIDNTVMISISGVDSQTGIDNAATLISTSRHSNVSIPFGDLTESLLQYAHAAGTSVKTWYSSTSSDTQVNAKVIFDMGVESILSEMFSPDTFDWMG